MFERTAYILGSISKLKKQLKIFKVDILKIISSLLKYSRIPESLRAKAHKST